MKYWEYKRDNENEKWRQIIARFQFEHILRIGPKDDMPESIKSLTRDEFMDLINAKVLSKMKKDENEEKISKTIKHIIALAFCHKFSDPEALNALKRNQEFLLRDMADTTVEVYLTFARNNSKGMSVAKVMAFSEDQAKKTVDGFPPVMDVFDSHYEIETILIKNSWSNHLNFGDGLKGDFLKASKALLFGKDYVHHNKHRIPEDLMRAIKDNNFLALAQYMQMREFKYLDFPHYYSGIEFIKEISTILEAVNVEPIHNYSEEAYNLNTLSKKESLTPEEKKLLEKARMTIFSNYGDPSPERNAEMANMLGFKDISEYEVFKTAFRYKMRHQDNELFCNDLIAGFINEEEVSNLITACLKMLKCEESSSLVGDLIKTVPYIVLMKERTKFDDPDYEWLIAKKVVASNMRLINYSDFCSTVTHYHAIFDLLEYDWSTNFQLLWRKAESMIINKTVSVELIQLFLQSCDSHLKYLSTLVAIKMMDSNLDFQGFQDYGIEHNVDNAGFFIAIDFERYCDIAKFGNPLSIDQLIIFAESNVDNVRRLAEIKLKAVITPSLPMEDLMKIASCNNETVASAAREVVENLAGDVVQHLFDVGSLLVRIKPNKE